MREYGWADVATVHHDAFFLAHGLLRCGHGFAHKGQSCNGTDVLTHFKGADFVFHALFVEVSHRKMGVRVEFEMHFDVWHPRLQGFGLHTAIGIEELLTKGEEGDGTIHGSTIYIDVTYLLG